MTQSDIGIVELRSCPFCSGKAESYEGSYDALVKCDCGAEGPIRPTGAEAISAWNTRDPIIMEMVEALEDIKAAALRDNGPLARDHDADTLRTIGRFADITIAKVRSK